MGNAINDKYFTKPTTVDMCLDIIDLREYDVIFEPSAGCGSFLNKLPKKISKGIDLSPDIPDVIELDFYNIEKVIKLLDLQRNKEKKYLSIGNPPFGTMSKMAIDFFDGCSLFSDTIAFIVPRTFRKISITNRLPLNFSLRQELILPKNSFLVMDPKKPSLTSEYDVPCVFQIWDKTENIRTKVKPKTTSNFIDFESDIKKSKYAFRRVGSAAGDLYEISKSSRSMSAPSHFYINCKNNVASAIRSLDWGYSSSKYDTAGNPSISKNELIRSLEKYLTNSQ